MKIKDIVEIIKKDWTVHFEEIVDDIGGNSVFYATMSIEELYEDWHGECANCPENGAFIYSVMFSDNNGSAYFINTGYEFTFEDLMRFIEGIIQGGNTMKITNYEDMISASKTIKKIADEAVSVGTKNIQKVNESVIGQMADYIYETLKPMFNSPITWFNTSEYFGATHLQFRRRGEFYNEKYRALLRNHDLNIVVYFDDSGYDVRCAKPESVSRFVGNWEAFKVSLDTTITNAIKEYNKKREAEVDRLAYLSQTLESFEV